MMKWPPPSYGAGSATAKRRSPRTARLSAIDLARLLHTTQQDKRNVRPTLVHAWLRAMAWGEEKGCTTSSTLGHVLRCDIAHGSGVRARARTALGAISMRVLGRYVQPGEVVRGRPYPPWSELRKLIGE